MSVVENSNVTIAHLGIVAGLIDTLGIVDYIDQEIPKKRHHAVTHGEATKALLLNGLGYVERRLFLMPEYFEDIATERLIKEGIKPDQLNQYVFGESLDAIAAYGPTCLFTGMALQMLSRIKMGTLRLHYDTTSINVTGEYDSGFNTRLIQIVHGHSKDHRSDIKQFIFGMATNHHGIPLFVKTFSGNESDKKTLLSIIQSLRKNLNFKSKVYHIADSAFFTEENLRVVGPHMFWISRVPATIGAAKDLLNLDTQFSPCNDPRYTWFSKEIEYAGIPQKWIMYQSSEMRSRTEATFEKNL